MKFKRLFALVTAGICFLSVFSAGTSRAEMQEIDFSGRGVGYSAVLYDNSNGLPTSEANSIVQSADGLIWIGGYSGLIRYDGNEFYRYDSSSGIASVVSLFADSRGRLWIGTNDSGIAYLFDDETRFFTKDDGLRSSSIRSISEDDAGNILIASTKGIYYIDTEDNLHLIDNPQTNDEYVCELCKGNDGIIYAVTLSGSVFTVEDCRVSAFYSGKNLGLTEINTVYPDPDAEGFVYIGSQGSEIWHGELAKGMKDAAQMSLAPYETVNAIRKINGMLWVCTDSGIGFFADGSEFVPLKDIPMSNSVDHVIEDYEGSLWFSSSRQGIMKIVNNRFNDISARANLEPLVVNSTCIDGDYLYIGTDTGLVILDNDYNRIDNSLTAMLENVRIRCIKKDTSGKIWFCTYSSNALVGYNPQTQEAITLTEENGMASNRVRMLKVLPDGRLAVATNGGMNIVENDTVTATYGGEYGISNLEILCIEEGEEGVLYLGSDGDGIYKLSGNKITRIGAEDGLKSEVILRIKKDSVADAYWVITSNSIGYMENDKIKTITEFPYSNNFDVFFDDNGGVWVLSSNGIYSVRREDMIKNEAIEYTLYDSECGIPGIATANSYSCTDEDGTLYVAATTGVFSFNINENTGNDDKIRLRIPFVSIDDKNIWIHDESEIHIPHDTKRLSIYANAMTFTLNNPHLSYILEGFDEKETHVTKQNMSHVSYTNLSGGTYTFKLAIINEVTGEEVRSVKLTIIKDKAIYENAWFLIASGVFTAAVIAAVVIMIYHGKTKRLIAREQEKQKLVDEIVQAFSGCVDLKDAYTNGHSARVAKYSAMIAKQLGKDEAEVKDIYNIALLHDIGKIGIPDNILNKPGRLDDQEFAIMKSHSAKGQEILKGIEIAPRIALGAGYHHEKYDGTGYPKGLAGEDIPEIAQIIAVADAFDAMYSTRPYRSQLPLETVVAEIKRCIGTQFAPRMAEAFLQIIESGVFDEEEAARAKARAESEAEEKAKAEGSAEAGPDADSKSE